MEDGNLHPDYFNGDFTYCESPTQLRTTLNEYQSRDIMLACTISQLSQIVELLSEYSNITTIYIRADSNDIWWPIELEREGLKCIEIGIGENELMRHLYVKAMLFYFQQGKIHKTNKNHGLANRCFIDAKNALEKVEQLLI